MAGNGHVKENLPPLTAAMSRDKIHKCSQFRARRVSPLGGASRCAANHSRALLFSDPFHTFREQSKFSAKLGSSNNEPKKAAQCFGKPVVVKEQRNSIMKKRNSLYYGRTRKASVDLHVSSSASQRPSALIAPVRRKVASSKNQKFSLLHEDVRRRDLFEDDWLKDQEASLAHCVNGLFENTNIRNYARALNYGHLRWTLLSLYQEAECSLLRGRLKASLLYGCLTRPKGSLDGSSLKSDIEIRGNFISLWA